jgi:hypothetical protein
MSITLFEKYYFCKEEVRIESFEPFEFGVEFENAAERLNTNSHEWLPVAGGPWGRGCEAGAVRQGEINHE